MNINLFHKFSYLCQFMFIVFHIPNKPLCFLETWTESRNLRRFCRRKIQSATAVGLNAVQCSWAVSMHENCGSKISHRPSVAVLYLITTNCWLLFASSNSGSAPPVTASMRETNQKKPQPSPPWDGTVAPASVEPHEWFRSKGSGGMSGNKRGCRTVLPLRKTKLEKQTAKNPSSHEPTKRMKPLKHHSIRKWIFSQTWLLRSFEIWSWSNYELRVWQTLTEV